VAAVSLKLSGQEAALDAEFTRRVVSSAYTKLPKWSWPISGLVAISRKIQLMVMLKRAGARTQPCLTPLVVWIRSEKF